MDLREELVEVPFFPLLSRARACLCSLPLLRVCVCVCVCVCVYVSPLDGPRKLVLQGEEPPSRAIQLWNNSAVNVNH